LHQHSSKKDPKLHQKSIKTTFELQQNSSITIASKSALNLHQHHHQKALELHQKQQQKITVTTTKQLQNCTRKAPKTDSKIAPKKQHHIRTKTTQKLHQTFWTCSLTSNASRTLLTHLHHVTS